MIKLTRAPFMKIWCKECGELTIIHDINLDDLQRWHDGTCIQEAMPYLDENERELVISATCGVCWDIMFPDKEND